MQVPQNSHKLLWETPFCKKILSRVYISHIPFPQAMHPISLTASTAWETKTGERAIQFLFKFFLNSFQIYSNLFNAYSNVFKIYSILFKFIQRIISILFNSDSFFKNLFLLIFYNYYYLFSWLTIIIFSHKKFKNALFWKLQKKILIYIYLYTWIPIIMYTVFVIINLIGLIVL